MSIGFNEAIEMFGDEVQDDQFLYFLVKRDGDYVKLLKSFNQNVQVKERGLVGEYCGGVESCHLIKVKGHVGNLLDYTVFLLSGITKENDDIAYTLYLRARKIVKLLTK